MIVVIESSLGDRLLSGGGCSKAELKSKFSRVISLTDERNFSSLFCSMFQFDEYAYSPDVMADYVIDLDARRIYRPRY